MAKKNDEIDSQKMENTDDSTAPEMKMIEVWKNILKTQNYIFAGTKLLNGWADGKSVTKAEYERGIKNFLSAPAGGK